MLQASGIDPTTIVMIKVPVPMQNVGITGIAPDGTMIVTVSLGIPGGLLQDQLGKSRLVNAQGVPTGAAAVIQNALAPVTPMFVFGIKQEALSETAKKALTEAEAAINRVVPLAVEADQPANDIEYGCAGKYPNKLNIPE